MLRLAPPRRHADRRSTTSSRSPSAEELRAARAAVDATEVHDEVVGYVVAIVRRTRELPSVVARRQPARRGAPARRGQGRRPARRPRLRHPRRRRPHGRAGPAPPPRPHARRPSSSAPPRARSAPRSRTCRSRDEPRPARGRRRSRALALLGAASCPLGVVALARRGARRRGRRRRAGRPAPAGGRRARVPEVLARGVPAPLRVDAPPPAGGTRAGAPGGAARARRRAAGGRRRADATLIAAAPRPAHAPAGRDPRDRPAQARPLGPPRPARTPRCASSPTCTTARRLALAVARGRFRDQGATARGPLGLGTEFELIRDYEPDDDIRQVNWRATARLGRPMSNQYRLEQDRDVLLLIDAGRLLPAPLGDGDDPRRRARRRRGARARRRRARRPLRRGRVRRRGPRRARAAPRGRRRPSCARSSTSQPRPRRQRLRARVPARRGRQARARHRLHRPARGVRGAAARRAPCRCSPAATR